MSDDQARAANLYSVARALTGAQTAADVASAVFASIVELGAASTGLWLVQAGRVRFVGGAGVGEGLPSDVVTMPLDAELPGPEAVRTARIITYGSLEERDARWPRLTGVATGSAGTAVLPLIVGDRCLGCLHISYPSELGPDDFDLPFLEGLAELCAAALDRAQMHDAQRDRQALLLNASTAVAHAGTFQEAMVRLAEVAVPELADLCLIDVWDEHGGIRRMAAVHADPDVAALVGELGDRYPPAAGSAHPASVAMAEGRSIWSVDVSDEFLRAATRDDRHLELARLLHFTSYMSVPLIVAGQTLGAITLISAGSDRRFGPNDLRLAEDLAGQVADVVFSARSNERQHELAHVLQTLLLPDHLPEIDGAEISARYMTARRDAEAGGDFYDVVRLPSGRLGFVIGDVEGHDPVAAAIMGQLRSAIRALAGQHREPHDLIDALRWSWDLLGFSRMATCLIGRLDPGDGSLVLGSAGHLPPILVDAEGRAALMEVGNSPPLGAPANPTTDTRLTLPPGSTLFLYTDGLVERSGHGIDDGLSHLVDVLGHTSELPVGAMCDKVLANRPVEEDPSDDIAILAVRLCDRSRTLGPESTLAELAVPLDLAGVGSARSWVAARLSGWSEPGRSRAVLITSELVANGLIHARTDLLATLHVDGDWARLEVADGSPAAPSTKRYGEDAVTGRGLRLVARLSEEWGARPSEGGKKVWAVFRDRPWEPEGVEGAPELQFDRETPGAGESGTSRLAVRLLEVPLSLLVEAQQHNDAVMRELVFVTGSDHLSGRLAALAQAVTGHFAATADVTEAIEAAAEGRQPTLDLTLELGEAGWEAVLALSDLLDEADVYCERMELLTLASSDSVRALRRWYRDEVRAQREGRPPTPWPG